MKQVTVQGRRCLFDGFFKVDEVSVTVEGDDGSSGAPQRRLVFERGDSVAATALVAGRRTDAKTVTGLQWLLGRHR
jgi:hypothetical protein